MPDYHKLGPNKFAICSEQTNSQRLWVISSLFRLKLTLINLSRRCQCWNRGKWACVAERSRPFEAHRVGPEQKMVLFLNGCISILTYCVAYSSSLHSDGFAWLYLNAVDHGDYSENKSKTKFIKPTNLLLFSANSCGLGVHLRFSSKVRV